MTTFSYSSKNIPAGHASSRVADILPTLRSFLTAGGGEYKTLLESLRPAFDSTVLADAHAMASRLHTNSLKAIFVVGIGGSSLGAKAIVDALVLTGAYTPIYFLESIDPVKLAEVKSLCAHFGHADEFLVNVISKAGATTETVANFSILADEISHIAGWKTRVVVTTTHGSGLDKIAQGLGYPTLYMQERLSGRFSVFSVVGIFPLMLAGYPVRELLSGAEEVASEIGSANDPVRRLAEDILHANAHDAHLIDFFFFDAQLENLGKWARQLYAESLGKEADREGRAVRTGITPTVSIGSTDLHSMAQLYFAGPRDRLTILIPPISSARQKVPRHPFLELVPGLEGRTTAEINDAIYAGVFAAFREHRLMFGEAKFAKITPHMLGAFMQWQMFTVATVGEALNICAFDQPNVEDYKKVTRSLLARK